MSKKLWILVMVMVLSLSVFMTGANADVYVDDIVTFGTYEQDNDTDNGAEPIEWIVLSVKSDKALLISRYILDAKPYAKKYKPTSWQKSYLRSWLNGSFMDKAFTEEEQEAILTTSVSNSRAQSCYPLTYGGKNTKDKVFVLSYREVFSKYLKTYDVRKISATEYAKARGVKTYTGSDYAYWWLRTPGWNQSTAAAVQWTGERYLPEATATPSVGGSAKSVTKPDDAKYYATRVNNTTIGVRPAMWVSLDAIQ